MGRDSYAYEEFVAKSTISCYRYMEMETVALASLLENFYARMSGFPTSIGDAVSDAEVQRENQRP